MRAQTADQCDSAPLLLTAAAVVVVAVAVAAVAEEFQCLASTENR